MGIYSHFVNIDTEMQVNERCGFEVGVRLDASKKFKI